MLFTNLLPGLRELRAPVAAGYVTLLSVFLLWNRDLPSSDEAKGVLASLYDISDLVGNVGVVAALTFVAYLLGSVVKDIAVWLHDGSVAVQLRADALRPRARLAVRRKPRPSSVLMRPADAPVTNAASIGPRGLRGLRDVAKRAWAEAMSVSGGDAPAVAGIAAEALGRDTDEGSLLSSSLTARQGVDEGVDASEEACERAVVVGFARRTLEELDLVHTRLLGTEPELHGAVDRLRAEAELRLALVPTLMFLAFALAVRDVGAEHAAWPVFLTVATVPVLQAQAARRRKAAGDLLADALAIQRVQAPTLERFERLIAKHADRLAADGPTTRSAVEVPPPLDASGSSEDPRPRGPDIDDIEHERNLRSSAESL